MRIMPTALTNVSAMTSDSEQKQAEQETADFLNDDNRRAADFWALVIWYAIVCLALLAGWTMWEVFLK